MKEIERKRVNMAREQNGDGVYRQRYDKAG